MPKAKNKVLKKDQPRKVAPLKESLHFDHNVDDLLKVQPEVQQNLLPLVKVKEKVSRPAKETVKQIATKIFVTKKKQPEPIKVSLDTDDDNDHESLPRYPPPNSFISKFESMKQKYKTQLQQKQLPPKSIFNFPCYLSHDYTVNRTTIVQFQNAYISNLQSHEWLSNSASIDVMVQYFDFHLASVLSKTITLPLPKQVMQGQLPYRDVILTTQSQFDQFATLLCVDNDIFDENYYRQQKGFLGKKFWHANIFYGPQQPSQTHLPPSLALPTQETIQKLLAANLMTTASYVDQHMHQFDTVDMLRADQIKAEKKLQAAQGFTSTSHSMQQAPLYQYPFSYIDVSNAPLDGPPDYYENNEQGETRRKIRNGITKSHPSKRIKNLKSTSVGTKRINKTRPTSTARASTGSSKRYTQPRVAKRK